MAQHLRSGEYYQFICDLIRAGYPNLKFLTDCLNKNEDKSKCQLVQFSQGFQVEKSRSIRDEDFITGNVRNSKRLFILEGMPSAEIERLGAGLNIEPEFFSEHIQDTLWEHYHDKTNAMMLPSVRDSANFWTIKYFEPIFFPNESLKVGRTRLIPEIPHRRIAIRSPCKDQPHEHRYSIGLVSRFISFWFRKNDDNDSFDGLFSLS
jgi:hypothetical protein